MLRHGLCAYTTTVGAVLVASTVGAVLVASRREKPRAHRPKDRVRWELQRR